MPHYHFAVTDTARYDEPDGTELPDDAAAREYAIRVIRELQHGDGSVHPCRCQTHSPACGLTSGTRAGHWRRNLLSRWKTSLRTAPDVSALSKHT